MKRILIMVSLMLLLCSCQSEKQNDVVAGSSTSSSGTATSDEPLEHSTAPPPTILWGTPTDELKVYEDHDGNKNNYDDYVMTLSYRSENTEATVLLNGDVGSQFLTGLQNLDISEQHLVPPSNGTSLELSVTDAGVESIYFMCSSGDIYTVQNNKTYYLGKHSEYDSMLAAFLSSAWGAVPDEKRPALKLPLFDPFHSGIKFSNTEDHLQKKIEYNTDAFQVCVEWVHYGDRDTPIIIQNQVSKEGILKIINDMNEMKEYEPMTGGTGPIIRIYNENDCYHYRIAGEVLFDYNNQITLALADNTLLKYCREASAYEAALLLSSVNE